MTPCNHPNLRGRPASRLVTTLLLVAVAAAFAARLGLGLLQPDNFERWGDAKVYRELGHNVAAGQGLVMHDFQDRPRRADRMPGYPLVLAALEKVFGPGPRPVLVAQALLGALATWLCYLLGRQVAGTTAGLAAAFFMALSPWQVYFATTALTECWSAALLLAAVLCGARAIGALNGGDEREPGGAAERTVTAKSWGPAAAGGATPVPGGLWGRRLLWTAAAGLLVAGLVYVHPAFLGLLWLTGLLALLSRQRRRRLVQWLVLCLVVAAALGPWWARNGRLFGAFVPTTTRLGVSLYDGVWRGATGRSDMKFESQLADETKRLDERGYDSYYQSKGWAAVRENPARVARLAWLKVGLVWSPTPNAAEGQGRLYRWASLAAYVPMMVGAILGAMVLWRRRALVVLLLAPAALVTIDHLLLVGSARYRVPVEPLLYVLCGVAAAWVICRGRLSYDSRPYGG